MSTKIVTFKNMEIGHTYETHVLVLKLSERVAKNASTYVEFTLCDGDSTIVARQFNCSLKELVEKGIESESIVRVCINVSVYNSCKSYNITYATKSEETMFTLDDFVVKAPIEPEVAFSELLELVESSQTECKLYYFFDSITDLTLKILKENKSEFMRASAAKMIHHNVVGGLLYHTLTMVKQAKKLIEVYPNLDQELLICGAALHDIGKVKEMSTSAIGLTEYTMDGRLLGHAIIGIMMIEEVADQEYDLERVRLLQHMIAAHHGLPEYGAITQPAIPEALVLHAIDMVDSKMYVFNETYDKMEEGSLSEKIYALNGKTVYKPYDIGEGEKLEDDIPF